MNIKVNIRHKHLEQANPNNRDFCPIATALVSMGMRAPSVGACGIYFYNLQGEWKGYKLPGDAYRFMVAWDDRRSRHKCKPFAFEMEEK